MQRLRIAYRKPDALDMIRTGLRCSVYDVANSLQIIQRDAYDIHRRVRTDRGLAANGPVLIIGTQRVVDCFDVVIGTQELVQRTQDALDLLRILRDSVLRLFLLCENTDIDLRALRFCGDRCIGRDANRRQR